MVQAALLVLLLAVLSACGASNNAQAPEPPAFRVPVQGDGADPLTTAHALMRAGEFQLALRSFNRAVARDGPTTAALVGLGSANERLGRLPQAERYLRAAVAQSPEEIVAWNNLGVVLQAQDDFIGAETAFRMAFALDSGASDVIRQNLNAAALQAQGIDRSAGGEATNRLVSLGHGRYVLGQTPEQ